MRVSAILFALGLSANALAADLEVRLTSNYDALSEFDVIVTTVLEAEEGFLLGSEEYFVVPADEFGSAPVASLVTGYTGPVIVQVELFLSGGTRNLADDVLIARQRLNTTIVPGPNFALFNVTEPSRNVTKTATLFHDADGNDEPSPGDTVLYHIAIPGPVNPGSFFDFPGPGVRLLTPDGVNTSHGTIEMGNAEGDAAIFIDNLNVPAGVTANIIFTTDVSPVIVNQGELVSNDSSAIRFLTNDPDTPKAGDSTSVAVTASATEICETDIEDLEDAIDELTGDPDDDGVPAAQDHCAETAIAAAVDYEGCSRQQFCGSININVPRGRAECNNADWNNDEAIEDPMDCHAGRHVCEPA